MKTVLARALGLTCLGVVAVGLGLMMNRIGHTENAHAILYLIGAAAFASSGWMLLFGEDD